MEYYVKSVVPMIETNYDNFTTVEKNIADFFIKNRKKVDFSAKSVAEKLFVSEASCHGLRKNAVIGVIGNLSISMKKPLWRNKNPLRAIPEWY